MLKSRKKNFYAHQRSRYFYWHYYFPLKILFDFVFQKKYSFPLKKSYEISENIGPNNERRRIKKENDVSNHKKNKLVSKKISKKKQYVSLKFPHLKIRLRKAIMKRKEKNERMKIIHFKKESRKILKAQSRKQKPSPLNDKPLENSKFANLKTKQAIKILNEDSWRENKENLENFSAKPEMCCQTLLIDKNLQNQIFFQTQSFYIFFERLVDGFRKTMTTYEMDLSDVFKMNEHNKLITLLNQFLLYVNSFKIDLKKSPYKVELERNLEKIQNEILSKFLSQLKENSSFDQDSVLRGEITFLEQILKHQVNLKDIKSLKKPKKALKETNNLEINKSLCNFMGNTIQGVFMVDKLRSDINTSDEEKNTQNLEKLKKKIDDKIKNLDYRFKVEEIFTLFLEIVENDSFQEHCEILANYCRKIDDSDFKEFKNRINLEKKDSLEELFCEFVDKNLQEKLYLL